MEKLFDISVVNTLKDGINKGWWTLEDLDKPPQDGLNVLTTRKATKLFQMVIKVSNIKTLLGLKYPNQNRKQ